MQQKTGSWVATGLDSRTDADCAKQQGLPLASPEELGFDAKGLTTLREVLLDEVKRQRLPGAVAVIARHGKVAWFESVGALDPARPGAMPRDAIFRIYSMTKPVISVAAMMLVEQGKLLLRDPVAKYLPEYAAQRVATPVGATMPSLEVRRLATIEDLLRHTAGFTYEFLGSHPVQRDYVQARIGSRSRSNAEFSRQLAALPRLFEPGTVWEYSRATDVLGRVVEVASGQTLGAYVEAEIFQPLAMVDSGFSVPKKDQTRIAEPFVRDPEGALQMRMIDVRQRVAMESGGGGMVSTAMDYTHFLQFLLNRGELGGQRLLSAASVDLMTADHLGDIPINVGASRELLPLDHGFGLGFAVRRELSVVDLPGSVGSYFWGGMAGTTFFVDPAQELLACLMLQAPNQREYYRLLFRQLVYAALQQ